MARISRKNNAIQDKQNIFNVAIYTRISVDDKKSNSIENQKKIISNYLVNKSEYKVINIYEDKGITGATFNRDGFNTMIGDVKAKKVNCIIVKDLSRFGRDYIEVSKYLENIFPFLGVRFISVNDEFDSFNDDGKSLEIALKSLFNDLYRKDISKKIKSVLEVKRQKGEYLGAYAPYGYNKSEENRHKLVVNESEKNLVIKIYELYLQGNSAKYIVNYLNNEKIYLPNIISKNWNEGQVYRILKNRVYIGDMVQGTYTGKEVIVKNTHEPIIDEKMFFEVQNIREEKLDFLNLRNRKYDYTKNIYKGIIYCKECGRKMARRDEYTPIFICYTNKQFKANTCACKKIYEKNLNNVIVNVLDAEMKNISNNVYSKSKIDINHLSKKVRSLELKLGKTDNKKLTLYNDYINSFLTKEEYLYAKDTYEKEKESYNKQIESINLEIKKLYKNVDKKKDTKKQFETFLNSKNLTREILIKLIDRIEIDKNGCINIKFKFKDQFIKFRGGCIDERE